VVCWGVGDQGELGNGTSATTSLPVVVTGIADASVVAHGVSGACAARANGQIACWGSADSGQLGSGLRADVATPTAVPLSCTP
jgi:alpha-tubulin suppressor-like RCC1 family protein